MNRRGFLGACLGAAMGAVARWAPLVEADPWGLEPLGGRWVMFGTPVMPCTLYRDLGA